MNLVEILSNLTKNNDFSSVLSLLSSVLNNNSPYSQPVAENKTDYYSLPNYSQNSDFTTCDNTNEPSITVNNKKEAQNIDFLQLFNTLLPLLQNLNITKQKNTPPSTQSTPSYILKLKRTE